MNPTPRLGAGHPTPGEEMTTSHGESMAIAKSVFSSPNGNAAKNPGLDDEVSKHFQRELGNTHSDQPPLCTVC